MERMTHWERVEAAIAGAPTDTAPVSLWRHFPGDDLDPAKLAAHMVAWQRRWDFDLVKFMPPGTFSVVDWGAQAEYRGNAIGTREVVVPAVRRTDDWARVRPLDARAGSWGRQNQALRAAARELGGTVPILQTVFSPLTTARKMATDGLYADLRCHPDALHAALQSSTWFALLAPKGTPAPILDRLNADVNEILAMPDVRKRLADLGATPTGGTRDALRDLLAAETTKWARVVTEAKITLE